MDAKKAQDLVYVLGETRAEMGGSEYYALYGSIGNQVPRVDGPKAKKLYQALSAAMKKGLVASCHDCSDGGLGVALAEVAFAGGLGMEVDLRLVPSSGVERNDVLLFSESQSRFVVTVHPQNQKAFEVCMKGRVFARVGRVKAGKYLTFKGLRGTIVVRADIDELKEAWKKPLMW